MQRKQMWECDVCGLKNYNTRNLCFMRNRTGCTGVNPETGLDGCLSLALSAEWLCEECNAMNRASKLRCFNCRGTRSTCTHKEHYAVAKAFEENPGIEAHKNARFIMNNLRFNTTCSILVARLSCTHSLSVRECVHTFRSNTKFLATKHKISMTEALQLLMDNEGDVVCADAMHGLCLCEIGSEPVVSGEFLAIERDENLAPGTCAASEDFAGNPEEASTSPMWQAACKEVMNSHLERCNLLHVLDSEIFQECDAENTCDVCFQHTPPHMRVVMNPCGHSGVCDQCASEMVARQMACHVCLSPVTGIRHNVSGFCDETSSEDECVYEIHPSFSTRLHMYCSLPLDVEC